MLTRFSDVAALSEFKAKKLLAELKQVEPKINALSAEYVHFVSSKGTLDSKSKDKLAKLLTYDSPFSGERKGELFLITPLPGTISPWSSKATAIAHNVSLPIDRIERGTAYYLNVSGKIDRHKVGALLYDRMTQVLLDGFDSAEKLFKSERPRPLVTIDTQKKGIGALKQANKEMGLALSDDEIEYLHQSYRRINRNPTDLELMMFGVVNSEHCRHKIFNADWFIDGKKQPKSLFKMIKNTYENNPKGIISAYSDNSAILHGHKTSQQYVDPKSGAYEEKTEDSHLVIKVETHNHPTAIAPFPGAATGSGGEIRDENATGRGAKPKMGLTGFSVSNLQIPGYRQPWESDNGKPRRISSPLEIMVKAPLGGAAFNNEFGRPNTAGYFRTFEHNKTSNDIIGYHKPIMIAGGIGSIKDTSVKKIKLPADAKLIVIGGPAMLIGLAGGAASSMASGESDEELDFASVQRGNAEMQRRAHEVIAACSTLEQDNPILSLHDVGAGGLSNALTELVHDSGLGAKFELRDIDCAEPGLSPMEIWCNEAQERYVLAVDSEDLQLFESICKKERCPYSIIGETTRTPQLVINDSLFKNRPADIPMSLLFGGPPKITKSVASYKKSSEKFDHKDIDVAEAVKRILRIPAVASKKFLITIGDRNVGGMTSRDQMVGPWQVPVSDVAVSTNSYSSEKGEAMAMGERTPVAAINAPASARLAIAEAVTNIAAARINNLSDIKLSANWMSASGNETEDYNLFKTVQAVGEEFCPALNLTIPVGKDSLSMRTLWEEKGKGKSVTSPVSLIISAFAPVDNINKTLTPQLNTDEKSTLIFIDLAEGKTRLGGSALAQAYSHLGGEAPDVENPALLKNFFDCIQRLKQKGLLLAYHDRSDGGLFTTLAEMSFAARSGLQLDITELAGNTLEKLFNEEIGAVIQVAKEKVAEVTAIVKKQIGANYYAIGTVAPDQTFEITDGGKTVFASNRAELEKIWAETSYRVQSLRDNSQSADEEYSLISEDDKGINPEVTFEHIKTKYVNRPKVAILREQGVNGQNEMAAAFKLAGFTPVDVPMQNLQDKKVKLNDFCGLAACGGFSYGDVLGAGLGWAKVILNDNFLNNEFKAFFNRTDTFALGVCNGCQMLAGLKELIPGTEHWPKFLRNESEQFEARFVSVKINSSPSIFFKDMEQAVLPIPVAHGEGRAVFATSDVLEKAVSDKLAPLQYVDNNHSVTERYPLNPNGSAQGIAGLSSASGRALVMMPHPERAFLTYQNSWHPPDWPKEGPWLRMFQNARAWVEKS